tara:strand:- start:8712 stop:10073 length:1362 start_codon:yes stop_codon:yes gene_type:complete
MLSDVFRSLVPLEDNKCETMGVTYRNALHYNRGFVQECSDGELFWVFLHEAMHIFLQHPKRFAKAIGMGRYPLSEVYKRVEKSPALQYKARLWNWAADLAANQKIEQMFNHMRMRYYAMPRSPQYKVSQMIEPMPGGYLMPKLFGFASGQTTEVYFKWFLKRQQKKQDIVSGQTRGNENESQSLSELEELQDKMDKMPGRGSSGSSAGGIRAEWEKNSDKQEAGLDETHIEQVLKQTAKKIKMYEQVHGAGSVPGFLSEASDELLAPPIVHWTTQLQNNLESTVKWKRGNTHSHYGKANRRQMSIGGFKDSIPILPSKRAGVPIIALVGDTSASMSRAELQDIMATAQGVVKATGAELIFCACDTKVNELKLLNDWTEAAGLMTGRGGTDFRPAFVALEKHDPQPDVVIFVTDGFGPAPHEQPEWCNEVIWVLVETSAKPTEWGEYVYIEELK